MDRNFDMFGYNTGTVKVSPSTRRAWIEIAVLSNTFESKEWSPSTRRAWIEITGVESNIVLLLVALHPEGVDRNNDLFK